MIDKSIIVERHLRLGSSNFNLQKFYWKIDSTRKGDLKEICAVQIDDPMNVMT